MGRLRGMLVGTLRCLSAFSATPSPRPYHSLLAMLIKGETWSPADHKHYPPAFRAAVRTLLLAHRRSGSAAAGGGSKGSSARRAAAESEV